MRLSGIVSDRAQIVLLFYKPGATDPFVNRLVAFFDPPYCHVEMAFPERYGDEPWEKVIWGSSIFQGSPFAFPFFRAPNTLPGRTDVWAGEPVFFKKRSYQRDGYVSIALEVTLHSKATPTRPSSVHLMRSDAPLGIHQAGVARAAARRAQVLQGAGGGRGCPLAHPLATL